MFLFILAVQESKEGEISQNKRFEMYKNVGSDYYGDLDENDSALLSYERAEEEQGNCYNHCFLTDVYENLTIIKFTLDFRMER